MARAPDVQRTSSQGSTEPGLLDYLRILWRHKLVVVLTVVVAAGTVVGLDLNRTRTYQGTAEILFTAQGTSGSYPSSLNQPDVSTDIELIQSAPVQAAVAKRLHGAVPGATATEVGTTNVAQIAVQSTSPSFAAAAANAYARAYIQVTTQDYVKSQLATERQIEAQITAVQSHITTITSTAGSATSTQAQAQLSGLYSELSSLQQQLSTVQLTTAQGASAGQLIVPALPDTVPVSPKRTQDALIAAGVGLLLGIGFALLRDHVDDRIRNADDLEEAAGGLPTIGLIPALSEWRDRKTPFLVTSERPRSPSAEAYRALRTSIKFMALERPVKILQVTSPGASEGKTTTSANLACAMAESGQRVVLVDCDLRRPRVHEFFHLPNEVGLTSFLLGETPFEEALLPVPGNDGLLVLPSGRIPPNPSELLSGERTDWLFQRLAEFADIIILDSSPVLPVTDAVVLAARVDGVLLVAAAGVSTARALTRSLEMLERVDARLVGTVLNRAPEAASYGYHYGYSYANAPTQTNGNGAVDKGARPERARRQAR
jgi:succinoglycan biosynthesis transport protein ExoP